MKLESGYRQILSQVECLVIFCLLILGHETGGLLHPSMRFDGACGYLALRGRRIIKEGRMSRVKEG